MYSNSTLLTSLLTTERLSVRTGERETPDLRLVRGAVGNRTPDPFHAMEVLYQLSYSPERVQDDTSAADPLKT